MCGDCSHFIGYSRQEYAQCSYLTEGVTVLGSNNVCRKFNAWIKNPSSIEFNLDDYLEFLGSDYYRPWNVDTSIIIGSAKLGEATKDGGKLAELLPKTYSPWYKPYDKPYCGVHFPRCFVKYDGHKFEVDYRKYREFSFIDNGELAFDTHIWKDKPTAQKYKSEYYGSIKLTKSKRKL